MPILLHFKIEREEDGQWWAWNCSPRTHAAYVTADGSLCNYATMFKTYDEAVAAVGKAMLKVPNDTLVKEPS